MSTSVVLDASARQRSRFLPATSIRRNAQARLALVDHAIVPRPDAPPPAWISEPIADSKALAPGQVITLPLAGRNVPFTVAGVWRDYVRQQGAIVIERSQYVALTGDDSRQRSGALARRRRERRRRP